MLEKLAAWKNSSHPISHRLPNTTERKPKFSSRKRFMNSPAPTTPNHSERKTIMKKLIATVVTIVMLGIAPIATATPAQARGGEGWWPQTTKPNA